MSDEDFWLSNCDLLKEMVLGLKRQFPQLEFQHIQDAFVDILLRLRKEDEDKKRLSFTNEIIISESDI